jgi:hypothetical protein
MTKKQQQEFIDKPCQDNVTWAAQEMLSLPAKQRYQIAWALRKLHATLYKEWARALSLKELKEAVDMIK